MEEQDSKAYELLKQNQSIFSKLKQRIQDINQSDRKIGNNINNIKTPGDMLPQQNLQKENCFGPAQYSFNVPEIITHNQIPQKIEDISFCNQIFPIIPKIESIVFIPFNKLYRSPAMQLKTKDKIILARKYKGSSLNNKGKITDGKVYKFDKIITDEDGLFSILNNHNANQQFNIIGIIGAKSTLKKKIHMCLLIKEYQRLIKHINESLNCNIQVHYSQISEKILTSNQEYVLDIVSETKIAQLTRLNRIFQHLMEIITNKNKYYAKKSKNRTRISRIKFTSENERFLLEIVSTNNENLNFIRGLQVNKIVWCINPLVKNYDNSLLTFENVCKYEKQYKNN